MSKGIAGEDGGIATGEAVAGVGLERSSETNVARKWRRTATPPDFQANAARWRKRRAAGDSSAVADDAIVISIIISD